MENNRTPQTSKIPDKWQPLVERLEQLIALQPTGVTLVFIDQSTTVTRIHQHGTGNTNQVSIESTLTNQTNE